MYNHFNLTFTTDMRAVLLTIISKLNNDWTKREKVAEGA